MAINVECKQCGKRFSIPDQYAGKRAKCKCGGIIQLPAAPPAPAPPPAPARRPAGRRERDDSNRYGPHHGERFQPPRTSSSTSALYIGGGVVLLAILVLLLVASINSSSRTSGVPTEPVALPVTSAGRGDTVGAVDAPKAPDVLACLPEGLQGVGYIDLKQLLASPFGQKLLDTPSEAEPGQQPSTLRDELKKIALDPKNLVAAAIIIGTGPDDSGVVVSGAFDSKAIYKEAAGTGGKESTYKGVKVMTGPAEDGKPGPLVAVMDNNLLVAGTGTTVNKVIDIRKASAKTLSAASPLLARTKTLKSNLFWLAFDVPAGTSPPAGDSPMPGLDLSKMKTVTIGGKVQKEDLVLSAAIDFDTPSVARAQRDALKDTIDAFVPMISPGLEKAIKLSAKETTVSIDVSLAPSVLQKGITILHIQRSAGPGPGPGPEAPPANGGSPQPPAIEEGQYDPIEGM